MSQEQRPSYVKAEFWVESSPQDVFDILDEHSEAAKLDNLTETQGQYHFTIEMDRSCSSDILNAVEEDYDDFEFVSKKTASDGETYIPDELTELQYEALVTAYEEGFYKIPRDINQSELGEMIDASSQSIGEVLRRGTRGLIEHELTQE